MKKSQASPRPTVRPGDREKGGKSYCVLQIADIGKLHLETASVEIALVKLVVWLIDSEIPPF